MINLLPPDVQKSTLYARRNIKLLRWMIAVFVALAGLVVIIGFGELYLSKSIGDYSKQADQTTSSLKAQDIDKVQKQVQDISGNIKLIIQVLSKEVLFSKLIKQIGAVMPSKTILSTIQISNLQGGIDLEAKAQDSNSATQVQVNMQDPSNKLFDKVDIVNITCGDDASDPQHPCKITLRASYTHSNPFLFINSSSPTKAANQ